MPLSSSAASSGTSQAAIAARTPDHVLPLAALRDLLMQLDALHAATH